MLHIFQSETNTEMTQKAAWKYLSESSFFVAEDWEQKSRKKFFDKFQKVTQVSFKKFEITTDDYSHILFPNCWIAESEGLLQSFQNSVDFDLLRLFEFIVSVGKFNFDKNCFRKIITTLVGERERAISIDIERSMSFFYLAIPREENFGIIMNLIENDAVKLFTEFNPGTVDIPLIFYYFRCSSFSLFKDIFTRIRQAKIRFSELLGNDNTNFLWHIGWGDCGLHKAQLVLQDAFEQKNDELERLLTQKNDNGVSVLPYHCKFANDPRIVQLLIKYSRTVSDKVIDERGRTLIHHASFDNQIVVLDFLIKVDQEKNYELTRIADDKGETCLHLACYNGNATIAEMLLKRVPELASNINDCGINALHVACLLGHQDTAQTFRRHYSGERFSNILCDDGKGNNTLHLAALYGCLDNVKLVVSLDSNILHSLNKEKQNIFHKACMKGHITIADWLLKQNSKF